jgi:hypothetical protein
MGSLPASRLQRRTLAAIATVSLLGLVYVIITSQQLTVQFPRGMYSSSPTPWNYGFKWTIFITPQDFEGIPDKTQRRAIQSWLRLHPKPEIVLVRLTKGSSTVTLLIPPHVL